MYSTIRTSFPIALLVLLSVAFTTSLLAAPMVRVVDVLDCRTIVVDSRGVAATIRLGQVIVAPGEEQVATDWLRSALVSSWVLVETDTRGESYVYRSPDSLFVNGELARRAWASGRTAMVWLGEANPGPQRAVARTSATTAKTITMTPPKQQRARTTPRGAHRIPRTQ